MDDELRAEIMRAAMDAGLSEATATVVAQVNDYEARYIGRARIGQVEVSTIWMPAMAGVDMYWETEISGVPEALAAKWLRWENEEAARANHEILVANFRELRTALNDETPE